jgi:hypothetical protein
MATDGAGTKGRAIHPALDALLQDWQMVANIRMLD